MVLGRHSFDINEFIKLTINSKIKYYERSNKLEIKGFEDIDIKYITVYKSKGLEADNVIVLNLKNHLLGFPNKMTDDPWVSLLPSDDEALFFAEEMKIVLCGVNTNVKMKWFYLFRLMFRYLQRN